MKIYADKLLTMTGGDISPGWVEIVGDKITSAGVGFPDGGNCMSLRGYILLPGLVNAHCHLDYTDCKGLLVPGRSFAEWIAQINALKRQRTSEEFLVSIRTGFDDLVRYGTTSVVNIESYPDLIASIDSPVRTWWAVESMDVKRAYEYPGLPELRAVSPHAPYTASPELYMESKRLAEETGALFTSHVAESVDEHDMFLHAQGSLYVLMKSLHRTPFQTGEATSLKLLLKGGYLPHGALLAHVNFFDDEDLALMHAQGHAVAHCPQTHAFFGRNIFPWQRMEEAGVPVILGTDSLASSQSLSLFDEMRAFRSSHPGVGAQRVLEMVTVDAARALGMWGRIGQITVGAEADLIAIPFPENGGRGACPFSAVLEHSGTVPFVMSRGRVLRAPQL